MTTLTATLIGADDRRAPVAELRSVFTADDQIICRLPDSVHWKPLFSTWLDDVVEPVEWDDGGPSATSTT